MLRYRVYFFFKILVVGFFAILHLIISGCRSSRVVNLAEGQTPSPFPSTPSLILQTAGPRTPTPLLFTPAPPVLLQPSPTLSPTPSATPVLHTIREGEMLGVIAFRYGVTVQAILTANPGVDPQFLRIGDALVIPLQGGESAPAVQPGVLPDNLVLLNHVSVCYPAVSGWVDCYLVVENQSSQPVESLAAQVTIYGLEGNILSSGTAQGMLNLLPAGESMPLAWRFAGSVEPGYFLEAQLVTALPVDDSIRRYLPGSVLVDGLDLGSGGLIASLNMSLVNTPSEPFVYRVLMIAEGEQGEVVGVRLLEGENEGDALPLLLEGAIYAYAPISKVRLLFEALP